MASTKYPARVNLRLRQETYDVYAAAAEATGMELASLIRQLVEESVPAVQALTQAAASIRAGRSLQGMNVALALADQMLAQSATMKAQTVALTGQLQGVEDDNTESSGAA